MSDFLRRALINLLEIAIAGAVLFGVARYTDFDERLTGMVRQELEIPFPELQQGVKKNFTWQFKSLEYEIPFTLYGSVASYYAALPHEFSYTGNLPEDWEQRYYAMFLQQNPADTSISTLAEAIRSAGIRNGLSEDEIVELALAFVQAIPYDEQKARTILSKEGGAEISYPYEVLSFYKGVCSDKSILGAALMRELGYGAALLAFNEDNHMALGIRCPDEYSMYSSGYCYAETTSQGHRIGIMPEFDADKGRIVENKEFSLEESGAAQSRKLGQAQVLNAVAGKEYRGIEKTMRILGQIDSLTGELSVLRNELTKLKADVTRMEKEMVDQKKEIGKLLVAGSVKRYNKAVDEYNSDLAVYQKTIKAINDKVGLYNRKVASYNELIKQ